MLREKKKLLQVSRSFHPQISTIWLLANEANFPNENVGIFVTSGKFFNRLRRFHNSETFRADGLQKPTRV